MYEKYKMISYSLFGMFSCNNDKIVDFSLMLYVSQLKTCQFLDLHIM